MVKPLGARAFVKRLDAPKPTSSLIEIPDTIVNKPSPYALVLAVGKLVQGGFKPNDVVILRDFAGSPCTVMLNDNPIEGMIVPEDEVLAVVEGM